MLKIIFIFGLFFSFTNANDLMCKVVQKNKNSVVDGKLNKIELSKEKIVLYDVNEKIIGYPNSMLADTNGSTSYMTSDENTIITISDTEKTIILSKLSGESTEFFCDRYNDDYYSNKPLDNDQAKVLDEISTDNIVEYIVNNAKEKMPIQLDDLTRTINVSADKNTIKYTHTIDIDNQLVSESWKSPSVRKEIIKELQRTGIQTTCGVPVVNYLIVQRNVTYLSEYLDLSQKPLFALKIVKEDCLNANIIAVRSEENNVGYDSILQPLREKLPMKIDDMTTLISVSSASKTIKYIYSLKEIGDYNFALLREHRDGLKEDRLKSSISAYCSDPFKKNLLKDGAIIDYSYVLGDTEPYFDFHFSLRDCDK